MHINYYYSRLVDVLDVWITKKMESITSSKYVKLDCNTKEKINFKTHNCNYKRNFF